MKMAAPRLSIVLGVPAFAITLAVIVGQRMSSEAMAVLLGVVAGVMASIPTSLIVVWLATRALPKLDEAPRIVPRPQPEAERAESRRVIVMQPPAPGHGCGWPPPQYAWPNGWPYPAVAPPLPYPSTPRKFTVIGGSGEVDEPPSIQNWEAE